MSPELSSQPEPANERPEDEPLDAIVFEVHPALRPGGPFADYAYSAPSESPFQVRPEDVYRRPPMFSFALNSTPAQYVVPQRFGLSAILGIMTALALLFGIMRWLGSEPGWYLFLGAQSIVICLVQMFHGKTPRAASAVAGAILAPLFVLGWAWLSQRSVPAGGVLCLMFVSVPLGGFVGYLNGTCAAGIFLVMEKLEPYLQGQRPIVPAASPSPPVPSP
jgi:hypothetical protein